MVEGRSRGKSSCTSALKINSGMQSTQYMFIMFKQLKMRKHFLKLHFKKNQPHLSLLKITMWN